MTQAVAAGAMLLLVGCHVPNADVTTTQDPKYPVDRQSKIGFPAEPEIPDVNARLAGEFAQEQMRRMGFNVVSPGEADYLINMKEAPSDLTVAESDGGPAVGTGVGGGNGGLFTGIGVGIPIGPPQAVTIHRTELDAALETTQSPKIVVWQGKIIAETEDATKYRGPFFRVLLSRLGSTSAGTIRLDKPDDAAPRP